MKPVAKTPYLPNAGRARDLQALDQFDQDLVKALFQGLTEFATRLNAVLPKDGSEPMTGNLNMGGFNIINVGNLQPLDADLTVAAVISLQRRVRPVWPRSTPATTSRTSRRPRPRGP